jgi:hypothetical protein
MNSNILEKSLAAQKLVFNQSRDPVQKARVKSRIEVLEKQLLDLQNENIALRKQLKSACNALMEIKLK